MWSVHCHGFAALHGRLNQLIVRVYPQVVLQLWKTCSYFVSIFPVTRAAIRKDFDYLCKNYLIHITPWTVCFSFFFLTCSPHIDECFQWSGSPWFNVLWVIHDVLKTQNLGIGYLSVTWTCKKIRAFRSWYSWGSHSHRSLAESQKV